MRIFFIPGLGEQPFIFDKIQAAIPGEKVFIDNWSVLPEVPENGLSALVYAKYLIDRFKITTEDVVIGHSLGAWVALQVKQLVDCQAVQIAGWTNKRKVIKPVPNLGLMYWMAKHGWCFNRFVRFIISIMYANKRSKQIILTVFDKLKSSDKTIVAKQLMVVYNPIGQPLKTGPDLRIHSKIDYIVRPPDEPFYEVPGDHFALYTYPETVYKPIAAFINQLRMS